MAFLFLYFSLGIHKALLLRLLGALRLFLVVSWGHVHLVGSLTILGFLPVRVSLESWDPIPIGFGLKETDNPFCCPRFLRLLLSRFLKFFTIISLEYFEILPGKVSGDLKFPSVEPLGIWRTLLVEFLGVFEPLPVRVTQGLKASSTEISGSLEDIAFWERTTGENCLSLFSDVVHFSITLCRHSVSYSFITLFLFFLIYILFQ